MKPYKQIRKEAWAEIKANRSNNSLQNASNSTISNIEETDNPLREFSQKQDLIEFLLSGKNV